MHQLYSILFDLQVAGYIPVLRIRRYLFYHNNFNEYVKLKEPVVYFSSIYCQLWVITVLKYKNSRTAAEKMYSYVGSDVHHNNHMPLNKSETERFSAFKKKR
jgi:tyrosine-protein phosphatase YwqE